MVKIGKDKILFSTLFLIIILLIMVFCLPKRSDIKSRAEEGVITTANEEVEYYKGIADLSAGLGYLGTNWSTTGLWGDNTAEKHFQNRVSNGNIFIRGDWSNADITVQIAGPTNTEYVVSEGSIGKGCVSIEIYEGFISSPLFDYDKLLYSANGGANSCDMSSTATKTIAFAKTIEFNYNTAYTVYVYLQFKIETNWGTAIYQSLFTASIVTPQKNLGDGYNDPYMMEFKGKHISRESNIYYTNDAFTFTYKDGSHPTHGLLYQQNRPKIITTINGSEKYNGEIIDYLTTITEEGTYNFVVTNTDGDDLGSFTIIIDKTARKLKKAGTSYNNIYGPSGVTLTSESTTWPDVPINNFTVNRYTFSIGKNEFVLKSLVSTQKYSGTGRSVVLQVRGIYKIVATDVLGNSYEEEVCILPFNQGSSNKTRITELGYFKTENHKVIVPYMQEVNIPTQGKDGLQSIYPGKYSNGKTYVFATYENALQFSQELIMQAEVRVTTTDQNGNALSWEYKQLNNANATMRYTTVEELHKVVAVYAQRNISEYGEVKLGGNVYINESTIVMDDDVYMCDSKDGTPLIGGDYVFETHLVSLTSSVAPYNTYTYSTIKEIVILDSNGKEKYSGTLNNKKFSEMVGDATGLLTIKEYDTCNNVYSYKVYYDCASPQVTVDYEYYTLKSNNNVRQHEIQKATATLINGLEIERNLKSLIVKDIEDIADEIVMARVEKPDGTIVVTRDISTLQFGVEGYYEDGGEYRIKFYDRSLNMFEFAFAIAGETPKASGYTKGLGENKYLNITFYNPNNYSSITHFTIYRYDKALPNGYYEEIVDGEVVNSMTISQDVWSYNFELGGSYKIRFTDSFNRVSESEEIVFKKGLPEYTLKGVTEDGKTNKTVTLTFSTKIGYEATLAEVAKTVNVATTTDGEYIIEIPATVENNGKWKIKLYQKSDEYNYIEIKFILDTIAPTATVKTADGRSLQWSSCVNTPFKIDWDEADKVERVKYSTDGGYGKTYSKEAIIAEDGIYTITLTDDVGNTTEYKIELDTTVEYKLELSGKNYEKEGTIYVADSFTLIDKENLDLILTKNGLINDARFNLPMSAEGRYEVILNDTVGNTVTLIIIVDKTAPTIEILPGDDDYSPVTVKLESLDIQSYKITFNNKAMSVSLDDELRFEKWGSYSVSVADALGNKNDVLFYIDKAPPIIIAYDIDGVELLDNSTTNKAIYFTWNDDSAKARVSLDGIIKPYEENTLLNDEGVYTITVTDEANNKVSFTVEVVKVIHFAFTTANGGTLTTFMHEGVEKTAEPFTVKASDGLLVTVKQNNVDFAFAFGQQIATDGKYEFYIYDELGNAEARTIVLDTTAPDLLLVPGIDDTAPVMVKMDVADVEKVEVIRTSTTTEKDTKFPETEMVFSDWGKYTITVADVLGNFTQVTFEIKKVQPTLTVQTISGRVLEEGEISQEAITIDCSEDILVKYRIENGYALVYKEGTILSEQGDYKITATDVAGNYVEINVTIDCAVMFGVIMDGTTIRDYQNVLVGKRYIEITPKENLSVLHAYNHGEAIERTESLIYITEEGLHSFVLTDTAGNSITLFFELDRTAPTISIDTEAITKSDVVLSVKDLSDVDTYKVFKDGLTIPKYILSSNNVFAEQGTYSVSVADALGNRNVLEFSIKRDVEYKLSVANGFITEDKVTLTLKESNLSVQVKKDGQALDLSQRQEYIFVETGSYEIYIVDELGNERFLFFVIDPTEYRKNFSFEIPLDSEIKLLKDGLEVDVDTMIMGDTLSIDGDGKYALTIKREGVTSTYEFVIDTVIPTLLINGNTVGDDKGVYRENLVLSCNKKTATMEVYYNGTLIDYKGEELDDAGTYKVVLRDKVGNVVEYEFEREFTFNTGAIILFVVGGASIALVIVLIIRRRIKQRIM